MTESGYHARIIYTMQNYVNCLQRAKQVFSQCSNKETQPITATFTHKDGVSKSETFPPQGNKGNEYNVKIIY